MLIRPYKEALDSTIKEIKTYQNKDKLPINTGYDFLDGLTPGSIVTIAGASFTGKTFFLNGLRDNIMNVEYNSMADNFIWLSNSLEMTSLMNVLRDLSIELGKSKKLILTEEFGELEKEMVNSYYKRKIDGRFFLNEEAMTPTEFFTNMEAFLIEHKDKELIGIDFDHVALAKGSNKKQIMDEIFEIQNSFKKTYPNSLWIDASQFNRESLGRIAEKTEDMKSRRSDLYQSDALFQASDVVACLSMPHKLGVEQYRNVSPYYYDYLADHFGDFNKTGTKVSFKTYGRIFIEILKNRFTEGFNSKDLFIQTIEEDTRPPVEPVVPKVKKPTFVDEPIKIGFKEG